MRFLSLHSRMEGFTAQGEKLKWETPNLELDSNGKFALTSVSLMFSKSPDVSQAVTISTSLMETDYYNTDGTIVTISPRKLFYQAALLERWNLDSSRPRNIVFTLRGVSVLDISFVRIVLAFE